MAKAKNTPAKTKKEKPALTSNKEIQICQIRNLTLRKTYNLSLAQLKLMTPADTFSDTITGSEIDFTETVPAATDNIQVIWGTVTNAGTKTFTTDTRAVNGTLTYDAGKKELTVSTLKNVSKVSMGIKGILDIGPVTETPQEPVAHVSVSIGNLNVQRDWIIDFSDKSDGEPGSYVRLDSLINWASGNIIPEASAVEIPEDGEGSAAKPVVDKTKYTVQFNDFYINITSKVFKFDVSSKDGEEIKFGGFTLKKAGLIITNEPFLVKKDEDEGDDE